MNRTASRLAQDVSSGKLNPQVNLVDTLNGAEFTVFAPVDTAFAKVDAATLAKLKTDPSLLTKVLTYHVVPGQLSLEQVAGMHTTVEGALTPRPRLDVTPATVRPAPPALRSLPKAFLPEGAVGVTALRMVVPPVMD